MKTVLCHDFKLVSVVLYLTVKEIFKTMALIQVSVWKKNDKCSNNFAVISHLILIFIKMNKRNQIIKFELS